MNSGQEEHIRDLIYETTMRDYLLNKKSRSRSITWILSVAASMVLLLALFLWVDSDSQRIDRYQVVSEIYHFPIPTKSRSGTSFLDAQLEDIKNRKYQKVLASLKQDSLDTNALYYKMHLSFVLDSILLMENTIEEIRSTTDLYDDEIDWLLFLDAYRAGMDQEKLAKKSMQLDSRFAQKAESMLQKLNG